MISKRYIRNNAVQKQRVKISALQRHTHPASSEVPRKPTELSSTDKSRQGRVEWSFSLLLLSFSPTLLLLLLVSANWPSSWWPGWLEEAVSGSTAPAAGADAAAEETRDDDDDINEKEDDEEVVAEKLPLLCAGGNLSGGLGGGACCEEGAMGSDSVASIEVGRLRAQSPRNASNTEGGVRAPNHFTRHARRGSPSSCESKAISPALAAAAAPTVAPTALMQAACVADKLRRGGSGGVLLLSLRL